MQNDLFDVEGIPEDAWDHLGETENRRMWPQSLVDMLQVVETEFHRAGLDEAESARLAGRAMRSLAQYFGGRMWYLPKGEGLATALRDREIFRAMRRGHAKALAVRYGLTEQRIYAICREQRMLYRRRHQRTLFESD